MLPERIVLHMKMVVMKARKRNLTEQINRFVAETHGPLIPSFGVDNSKVGENNASQDGRQEGD